MCIGLVLHGFGWRGTKKDGWCEELPETWPMFNVASARWPRTGSLLSKAESNSGSAPGTKY